MAKVSYKEFEISAKPQKSFPILFEGSHIRFMLHIKNISDTEKDITIPFVLRGPSNANYTDIFKPPEVTLVNGTTETLKLGPSKEFVGFISSCLLHFSG
ncbi:MAG: hypothetical protein PHY70_06040 [Methanocellales archaeon]|nr:hypothetical protein [Methanocellales archaeon]